MALDPRGANFVRVACGSARDLFLQNNGFESFTPQSGNLTEKNEMAMGQYL